MNKSPWLTRPIRRDVLGELLQIGNTTRVQDWETENYCPRFWEKNGNDPFIFLDFWRDVEQVLGKIPLKETSKETWLMKRKSSRLLLVVTLNLPGLVWQYWNVCKRTGCMYALYSRSTRSKAWEQSRWNTRLHPIQKQFSMLEVSHQWAIVWSSGA